MLTKVPGGEEKQKGNRLIKFSRNASRFFAVSDQSNNIRVKVKRPHD